jgi:hypothetical protein
MRGRGCIKATLAGIMVPLVLIILLGSWVIAGLVAALGMATGDFCQVRYTAKLLHICLHSMYIRTRRLMICSHSGETASSVRL